MGKTYRDLAGVMGPVDVDRPEWAEQYGVGDTIAFESPPDGEPMTAEVIGFSSIEGENYGRPVIIPEPALRQQFEHRPHQVVITEPFHIPPEELTQETDDA